MENKLTNEEIYAMPLEEIQKLTLSGEVLLERSKRLVPEQIKQKMPYQEFFEKTFKVGCKYDESEFAVKGSVKYEGIDIKYFFQTAEMGSLAVEDPTCGFSGNLKETAYIEVAGINVYFDHPIKGNPFSIVRGNQFTRMQKDLKNILDNYTKRDEVMANLAIRLEYFNEKKK